LPSEILHSTLIIAHVVVDNKVKKRVLTAAVFGYLKPLLDGRVVSKTLPLKGFDDGV
jgi:hypothetical protein